MKNNRETFNTIPHYIKDDFFDSSKSLNSSTLTILLYLRMMADVYGVVFVTAEQIRQDLYGGRLKRGTINDRLLSLRAGGYIAYENRKGSGGRFKVQVDQWLIRNGVWDTIEDQKNDSKNGGGTKGVTEVEQVLESSKRRLSTNKNNAFTKSFDQKQFSINGCTYNDKEKDKEVDNPKEVIPVHGFNPQTGEQARLLHFAEMCGDKNMNYYLGKYKKHGQKAILAMDRVEMLYKEADLSKINNKPSFFTSLVEKELKV